jgi:FdhE protein
MDQAWQQWLSTHPYLESVARFQQMVEAAARAMPSIQLARPDWTAYVEDRQAGIPLLRSQAAGLNISDVAATMLKNMVVAVAQSHLTDPSAAAQAAGWLLGGEADQSAGQLGMLRFLGWTGLRQMLASIIKDGAAWRTMEQWGQGYCPTCGAPPPMSQLVPGESGRRRWLACGCCQSRWEYQRIGCPFCGTTDSDHIMVIEIEGDTQLRIDACESCHGYLKTYTGQGQEDLLLADWSTLHLDVLARDRGLQRLGTSLYDLPAA